MSRNLNTDIFEGDDWQRIKLCGNPTCGLGFIAKRGDKFCSVRCRNEANFAKYLKPWPFERSAEIDAIDLVTVALIVRAWTALDRLGIRTVGELADRWSEFQAAKFVGQTTVESTISALKDEIPMRTAH